MKFRYARLIFVIVVISIVIYAIYIIYKNNSNNSKTNDAAQISVQYAKDIKLGIANFDTMNPLITNNKEVININKLIFEPLFTLDEQYRLTPCLATEFAKIDETTYLVKINNTIQWSNGEKITASDVIYTVEKLKKLDSIYSVNVQNIKLIEEIDESTIKIQINNEEPFFEYNLIFPIIKEQDSENLIGTGILKISSINQNSIILEKNSNWRNPENQTLICENVYIYLFETMGEVYNSFKIGNIDFISTSSTEYTNYIGTIGYYAKEYKGRNVDFISINCSDSILSEKSVRKAISYVIDKNNIISNVYNNNYYVSDYPIDYGTFLYNTQSTSLGYNPEQAKTVLQESGWVNKNNKWIKNGKTLSFNLIVNSSNTKRCEVAEIIKQQLEQVGIIVNIKKVSDSQYMNYLQNKNYQLILTGVSNALTPDLTYFYADGNIANYTNEEVKNILNEIKNITDEKILLEKYNRIIELTKEEVPYICLYRNKNTVLIKQNAGGQIEPNNYCIYYNFWSWHRE